jgi:ferredoxin
VSTSIAFTLDGESIHALAGESILKAAQRHGVEIPHLCYSDGLRADGNCRACVVEIDGERSLAPSCCRNVTPGMQVKAQSPRALKSQAMVVEMLLSDIQAHSRTLSFQTLLQPPAQPRQRVCREPISARSMRNPAYPMAGQRMPTPATFSTENSAFGPNV